MIEYETPRDDYTRWLEERVRAMTEQIGELESELKRRGLGPDVFAVDTGNAPRAHVMSVPG